MDIATYQITNEVHGNGTYFFTLWSSNVFS